MQYFKVVQNKKVIDIGINFYLWSKKYRLYSCCDINKAQAAGGVIHEVMYHDDWLTNLPSDANNYCKAQIVLIEKEEFDELKELLEDGEPVIIEEKEEEVQTEKTDSITNIVDQYPHLMTIQEMREKIIELSNTVESLINKH